MVHSYLVRYGQMRRLGRFWSSGSERLYLRGEAVVLQTHRGLEPGEVLLIEAEPATPEPDDSSSKARILRAATSEDLELAQRVAKERDARYLSCLRLLGEGVWPFDLIDVEPLLDADRTVLYYLGPHGLDVKSFAEAAKVACGLEIVLEPVGLDLEVDSMEAPEKVTTESGCGSCGSKEGGCGSGCGTSSSGGGCSGCELGAMLASRRPADVSRTR